MANVEAQPVLNLDWQAYRKFVDEFKTESDRTALVLRAARLDSPVGQLIDRFLVPSPSSADPVEKARLPTKDDK